MIITVNSNIIIQRDYFTDGDLTDQVKKINLFVKIIYLQVVRL